MEPDWTTEELDYVADMARLYVQRGDFTALLTAVEDIVEARLRGETYDG